MLVEILVLDFDILSSFRTCQSVSIRKDSVQPSMTALRGDETTRRCFPEVKLVKTGVVYGIIELNISVASLCIHSVKHSVAEKSKL